MKLVFLTALLASANALIAYDCGSKNSNITTISLLEVGKCRISQQQPIIVPTYVQLLQLSKYSSVHVKQCRVTIDRTIHYCGAYSHNSAVQNGWAEYIEDTSRDACDKMHLYGSHQINAKTMLNGIRPNSTTNTPVTLAGQLDMSGSCKGTDYADPFGSWSTVIVQAEITITVQDYYATAEINDDKLVLRSGINCQLSKGHCIDTDGAKTFWNPVPVEKCEFNEYDLLHEGEAKRIYDNTTDPHEIHEIYSVTTDEVTFALERTGSVQVCGYLLIKTEHPKLFILETTKSDAIIKKKSIMTKNLDIFAYINSKFIYLDKHIQTQVSKLYWDVMSQKCELERQVLTNALLLAKIRPAEFAAQVMQGPGYMANIVGEVAHVIKCVAVEVTLRPTNSCYAHLPVDHKNQSMFMTANTHILLNRSPRIDCNRLIPPMYRVGQTWLRFYPEPLDGVEPGTLNPSSNASWRYESSRHLGTTGIYSTSDIEKLRDHIMFPIEQTAVLDSLVRITTGAAIQGDDISLAHLFNEETINRLAERAGMKLWGWLTGFGTFSAGVIGIFITIRAIKYAIDTIIHVYALHRVFGWSIWIFGAFMDSLANFLLHFKRPRDEDKSNPPSSNNPRLPEAPPAPSEADSLSLGHPSENNDRSNRVYPDLKNDREEPGPSYHGF